MASSGDPIRVGKRYILVPYEELIMKLVKLLDKKVLLLGRYVVMMRYVRDIPQYMMR